MVRIAVFGALADPQVSHLVSRALKRGHAIVQVAHEGWAGDGKEPHSIHITREHGVRAEMGLAEPLEVDAAWVRSTPAAFPAIEARPGWPPVERADVAELMWHARQRAAAVEALIDILIARKKKVINPRAISPAAMLPVIAAAGVRVPDSLITDDLEAAREFAATRTVHVRALNGEGQIFPFDKDRDLKKSPILLRAVNENAQRVRVLIAGEVVASTVNITREGNYRPVELAPEVLSAVDRARQALGLIFAAIDLEIDPETPELYAITGADAQPSYLDLERATGHAITEALLDALENV